MANLSIKNDRNYRRVIFLKGKQTDFLEKIQTQLNLNLKEISELTGVCARTITDWKRERYSMPLFVLKKLCREAKISLPKNIKIKNRFWYVYKGAKLGGLAVYKKYGRIGGSPDYRKKRWYEWWERVGRLNIDKFSVCKNIFEPKKSVALAGFIGIVLGDGCITSRQVSVTLNKFYDKYFIKYVRNLFKKLFKLNPSIYERKGEKIINIVVSRSELVKFLVNMGLKTGGKVRQQVEVPSWIEKSELFSKLCIRGLFDTDGCFYIDKHYIKNKRYFNCAMNFTNRSLPVLIFFKEKLEQFGFHPTRNTYFSVCLRREKEIRKYFFEIGSSNLKHLNKFNKYFKIKYGEVPKWS